MGYMTVGDVWTSLEVEQAALPDEIEGRDHQDQRWC